MKSKYFHEVVNCTFKLQITSRSTLKALSLQKPVLKDRLHTVWLDHESLKEKDTNRHGTKPHKFQSYDFNSITQSRDCVGVDHKITTNKANKSVYYLSNFKELNPSVYIHTYIYVTSISFLFRISQFIQFKSKTKKYSSSHIKIMVGKGTQVSQQMIFWCDCLRLKPANFLWLNTTITYININFINTMLGTKPWLSSWIHSLLEPHHGTCIKHYSIKNWLFKLVWF